jgi:glutamine amidotransferase-like uncharacterized protein
MTTSINIYSPRYFPINKFEETPRRSPVYDSDEPLVVPESYTSAIRHNMKRILHALRTKVVYSVQNYFNSPSVANMASRNPTPIASPDSPIFLYKNTMVEYCVDSTRTSLSDLPGFDDRRIHLVDCDELIQEIHHPGFDRKATLVIPGGYTTAISNDMKKVVYDIREKVVYGRWNYLGFCAGANMGSRNFSSLSDSYRANKLNPAYLLNLLNVDSKHNFYLHNDENTTRLSIVNYPGKAAKIRVGTNIFPLYWNQGSIFDIRNAGNIEVIGRYEDVDGRPPAIIAGSCGLGKVVLSHVHPEIDATDPSLFKFAEDLNDLGKPFFNNKKERDRLRKDSIDFESTQTQRINLFRNLCIRVGIIADECGVSLT